MLFLLYKIPLMVYQIVPATMMLAILLTLGMMTKHNEILALRTSGIPVSRIAAPFLGMSVLVSLGAFLLNEFVVSPAYQQSEYIRRILIEGHVPFSMMVRDRIWFKGEEGFYKIASFLPAKKEMQGVTWFTVTRPFQLSKRIDAARATWEEGQWVFYDVVERTFRSGELIEITRADRKSIDLAETPEDFEVLRTETDEMPLRKLRRYIRKIESEGYDSTPVSCRSPGEDFVPGPEHHHGLLGHPLRLAPASHWGACRGGGHESGPRVHLLGTLCRHRIDRSNRPAASSGSGVGRQHTLCRPGHLPVASCGVTGDSLAGESRKGERAKVKGQRKRVRDQGSGIRPRKSSPFVVLERNELFGHGHGREKGAP